MKIGDDHIQSYARLLEYNKSIHTLEIEANGLSAKGIQLIANALRDNKTLTSLNLAENPLGDSGAIYLLGALQANETLTVLNLKKTELTLAGSEVVGNHLQKNQTLTELDLSGNFLSSVTDFDYFDALYSYDDYVPTPKADDIDLMIFDYIPNSVTKLVINDCYLTEKALDSFLALLKRTDSLQKVEMVRLCFLLFICD